MGTKLAAGLALLEHARPVGDASSRAVHHHALVNAREDNRPVREPTILCWHFLREEEGR